MIVNKVASGAEVDRRVVELMRAVGLDPAYLRRYPYAFSGGQRQRIGIARALALGPQLIVADEPTSALDVSVQAQVLNLLKELQRCALSYIFISHGLSVIEHVSTRVAVMYLGRIVEIGTTAELFRDPRMPYTEALLSAITKLDPGQKMERVILEGDVADPAQIPSGCPFHPVVATARIDACVRGRSCCRWRVAAAGITWRRVTSPTTWRCAACSRPGAGGPTPRVGDRLARTDHRQQPANGVDGGTHHYSRPWHAIILVFPGVGGAGAGGARARN